MLHLTVPNKYQIRDNKVKILYKDQPKKHKNFNSNTHLFSITKIINMSETTGMLWFTFSIIK